MERQLSQREQEQMELARERVQQAVDSADDLWPDVCRAAALAHDCFEALKRNEFTEEQALALVGPLLEYLK